MLFRDVEPHDVLSVDHLAFLPGGTGWSAQSLRDHQDPVELDTDFAELELTNYEHSKTLDKLAAVTPEDIAEIVATPPDDWEVSQPDRAALAEYIARRQANLLTHYGR